MGAADLSSLPSGLPRPVDDGAAGHLRGSELPAVALPATNGEIVFLDDLGAGRTLLFVYPMTGRPGEDLPPGWDAIAGARGCTPEACGLRDHFGELTRDGIERVYGISSQSREYQREAQQRLLLPFQLLSDEAFVLGAALALPTFEAGATRYYRRLTMAVVAGAIEHVFYPVFPPDRHGEEVLAWLATARGGDLTDA